MLEAASRVFTNSLELVEEISSVALITAIFAGISAIHAIVESALLADTAILHGLVIKALDLVHEEEGDEEAGQDDCKPYKRALHVLNGESLTSLLLAVATDALNRVSNGIAHLGTVIQHVVAIANGAQPI